MFNLILSSVMFLAADPQTANQNIPSEITESAHDEMGDMDSLIRATEESLAQQKNIRVLLETYHQVENEAIAKPDNAAVLFRLAETGKKLYETIEAAYLADYFSADFMAELRKLKEIADKKTVPPAK